MISCYAQRGLKKTDFLVELEKGNVDFDQQRSASSSSSDRVVGRSGSDKKYQSGSNEWNNDRHPPRNCDNCTCDFWASLGSRALKENSNNKLRLNTIYRWRRVL